MKRFLAGLTAACAATLVIAAPAAQAAPIDPVKALRKQYVPGHGVRFTETASTKVNGKTMANEKSSGRLAFGKSGVVAVDVSTKNRRSTSFSPDRLISVGGHTYVQGGIYGKDLPEGKKWVRYSDSPAGATMNQPVDVFEPKVLRLLLTKAKSNKGGTYKGEISYKDIAKAYGSKLTGPVSKIKVSYALGVNGKGLVTLLRTSWTLDFGVLGKTVGVTETRYTGWGSRVSVKAPAESAWVDVKDLEEGAGVPEEIPQSAFDVYAY
ncbi:hypothetical protein AB0K40_41735 [Nonomuraea bangladeshensis]|jgi:hypothetical protein|uniref:Lipoprotein n=1 Tax=Nonomuraea bangladeshensis TaxID=404385 RepID=A0ABV3HHP9_9ACTN